MTFISEGQLIAGWNMILTLLKTTYIWSGFSLYLAIQLMMWFGAAAFLTWFLIGGLGAASGGGEEE